MALGLNKEYARERAQQQSGRGRRKAHLATAREAPPEGVTARLAGGYVTSREQDGRKTRARRKAQLATASEPAPDGMLARMAGGYTGSTKQRKKKPQPQQRQAPRAQSQSEEVGDLLQLKRMGVGGLASNKVSTPCGPACVRAGDRLPLPTVPLPPLAAPATVTATATAAGAGGGRPSAHCTSTATCSRRRIRASFDAGVPHASVRLQLQY